MALLTIFACGDDGGGGGGTEDSSTGGTGSATEATSSTTGEPSTTTSEMEGSGSGSSGEGSSTTAADGGSSGSSGASTGSSSDCEAQADEETCVMAMGCVWVGNAQNGTCLSDDPAVCPEIADMMQCQQHPACEWDNQAGSCVGVM